MLIFDENNHAVVIDSVTTPLTTNYFWVLDLEIRDFTLSPFLMLEETVAPHSTLEVLGFQFSLPTTWHLLSYSEETMDIDTVPVKALSGKNFTSFVHGFDASMVIPGKVKIVDYQVEDVSYGPLLNKHQMLCHPISPETWVIVSPSDVFNKYLKGCTVNDMLY